MIQTMSTPNEWFQFYNQNFSTPPSISDSTTTTATAIPATTATTMTTSPPLPSSSTHLSSEGRVSKPRRRSRASRKTPTTLLNTDTTNFRAMVQQFTGGPSALPFAPTAPSLGSGFPNLMGLGFGSRPMIPPMNPTTLMVSPPSYNIQQQHQQLYQNQNQQQFMFSGTTTQGGDNTFFQRLSNNPRPASNIVIDRDIVLMNDDEHGGGCIFPSTSSS
ncbi:hypothetical protein Lalb_Chr10g0093681 [Lupinus albus]|uniref:VQ domain-containing protein n=1 Tax=Lupinus albus TaxID=3870 RepID=A0A6A4PUF2_LUPAL|nr:hypothetical protein Lalb_Chr10g0093681 [Lupinus albus]